MNTLIVFKRRKKQKSEYAPVPEGMRTRFEGVTTKKDKNGFFVHTHRARSKSYPSLASIPDSVIKFIRSTG